jgi:hypothetical protein
MRPVLLPLLAVLPLLVGCMEGKNPSPLSRLGAVQTPTMRATPREPSLYEQLGGAAGVKAIVDDFVALAADDAAVPERLKKPLTDDDGKQILVRWLAAQSGGRMPDPDEKTPKDLWKDAEPAQTDWDALTANFSAALEKNKVGEAQRKTVTSAFQALGKEVVKPAP